MRVVGYLQPMLNPSRMRGTISRSLKAIREFRKHTPFDAIACRGVSGLVLASILSSKLSLPLIIVRKGEPTHSSHRDVEMAGRGRYVIVDDLIDSGETVKNIIDTVRTVDDTNECIGILLYNTAVGERTAYNYYRNGEYQEIPCLCTLIYE